MLGQRSRVKGTNLSEFVELCVGLHAAKADLGERLPPGGPGERPVQDRTRRRRRLLGQERFRNPQIRRKGKPFRYILLL